MPTLALWNRWVNQQICYFKTLVDCPVWTDFLFLYKCISHPRFILFTYPPKSTCWKLRKSVNMSALNVANWQSITSRTSHRVVYLGYKASSDISPQIETCWCWSLLKLTFLYYHESRLKVGSFFFFEHSPHFFEHSPHLLNILLQFFYFIPNAI